MALAVPVLKYDINMNDLVKILLLHSFEVLYLWRIFLFGCTYAANGWYNVIQNNEIINKQIRSFFDEKILLV